MKAATGIFEKWQERRRIFLSLSKMRSELREVGGGVYRGGRRWSQRNVGCQVGLRVPCVGLCLEWPRDADHFVDKVGRCIVSFRKYT